MRAFSKEDRTLLYAAVDVTTHGISNFGRKKKLLVKQLLKLIVLPLSLSQEYAALNRVLRSVSTGLCPATTKFEVGVAGTTFFRPCTRVKVRVTLNQCIRISTQSEARDLIIAWACDTLPFSSPSVIEFGLHRYHDSV